MNIKCFLFVLKLACLYAQDFNGTYTILGVESGHSYLTRLLNSLPELPNYGSVQEQWLQQPLDHFNSDETRTWQMRYLQNLELFQPNGPIFVIIGGEGPADTSYLTQGMLAYLMAQETRGALFLTEHRFYGQSLPLELTVQNLRYLSSHQALADIANFITAVKSSSQYANSKVVVIGGSYAGNLAAWMRELYPNLVDMAHSSSAPVLATENFYYYLEKVAQDFLQYGSQSCYDKIAQQFEYFRNALRSPNGAAQLGICQGVDMTIPENNWLFFSFAIHSYAGAAQYGGPQKVADICAKLQQESVPTPTLKSQCLNLSFESYIQGLLQSPQGLPWTYQTCTEFGYFQTSISDKSPFKNTIPVQFFEKVCSALFGQQFNSQTINQAISYTNQFYGGLRPNVTRVVFTNGGMDPYGTLGITQQLSDTVPAVMTPGSTHCADMLALHYQDSQELAWTKRFIANTIIGWLKS